LKNYILISLVLILLAALIILIQLERIERLGVEVNRLNNNLEQLTAYNGQNISLLMTYKELRKVDSIKIDSLAKLLKIRPKTITQYIHTTTTIHDTIPVVVLVEPEIKGWSLIDSGKCWVWRGFASLDNDSLKVNRTSLNYLNETTNIFYYERPKKFLFFRYGAKQYFCRSLSECGENNLQIITFVKK